jgi:hypothetical protein
MVFCALQLPDVAAPPGRDEEVFMVVPGTAKIAIAVPLDGLARFLPLLDQAIGRPSRPRCPACGAAIPGLEGDVCPWSQCAPTDPG